MEQKVREMTFFNEDTIHRNLRKRKWWLLSGFKISRMVERHMEVLIKIFTLILEFLSS